MLVVFFGNSRRNTKRLREMPNKNAVWYGNDRERNRRTDEYPTSKLKNALMVLDK